MISSNPATASHPLRASWYALLAAAALSPLLVGAVPYGDKITHDVFFSMPTTALSLLMVLSLGAWLWALANKETTPRWNTPLSALGTFAVLTGLSAVFALYRPLALIGDTQDTGGLVAWLLCAVAAFLVTQHVTNNSRLRTLTRAVVYGAGAVAALALVQRVTGVDPLGLATGSALEWMNARGTSTLGNPDFLGSFLVGPAVLALGLSLERNRPQTARVVDALVLALITTGCVGTLTRGAWVGLVLGLVLVLVCVRRDRTSLRAAAALAGISVVVAVVTVIALSGSASTLVVRLTSGTPPEQVSANTPVSKPASATSESVTVKLDTVLSGRLGAWGEALAIVKSRPVLGTGPANYRLGWYPVQGVTGLPLYGASMTGDPHSLPLLVAATLGLPALIALCALIVLAFAPQTEAVLRDGSGKRALYSAWWSALLGTLVTSLAGSSTLPFLLFVFIAIGVVGSASAKPVGTGRSVAVAVTAATLVVLVGLTGMAATLTLAKTRVQQAIAAGDFARFEAALQIAPWSLSMQNTYLTNLNDLTRASLATGAQTARASVDTARAKNDAAIRRAPLDFEFAYHKAMLLVSAGQILGEPYVGDSMTAIDKALELSPISLGLRTQKAVMLIDQGRADQAAATLEDVWDRDLNDDLAGATYVTALAVSGKYREAELALNVLKARFPDSAAVAEAERNLAGLRSK